MNEEIEQFSVINPNPVFNVQRTEKFITPIMQVSLY
jgi:hypothetical protein